MMRQMVIAALTVASAAAPARADTTTCIAKEEAAAAVIALMPAIVETAAERCQATLPESAFLRAESAALVERLRSEAGEPGAAIAVVFEKMGGVKLPAETGAKAALVLTEAFAKSEVSKLRLDQCPDVSDVVESLASMPSAKLGTLVAAILSLTSKDGMKKENNLRLCPAA